MCNQHYKHKLITSRTSQIYNQFMLLLHTYFIFDKWWIWKTEDIENVEKGQCRQNMSKYNFLLEDHKQIE